MKTPLNEGYTYTRGNQTNVIPVKIHQSRKPVPKGISFYDTQPKSQPTTNHSTQPLK